MKMTDLSSYEWDWKSALDIKNPPLFFPEHPTKDMDWDEVYRDMAGWNEGFASSTYLELGIKRMDSWMCNEIRGGKKKSKYTREQMEYMIKNNPHVHAIIKTNLLSNLKTIWE
jgi:hypothetical protein